MQTTYEVNNIIFRYPQGNRNVLNGASLVLNKGESLCIMGPNGAGKTTLLNCMAGLLKPASGEIKICGRDISGMKEKEISEMVGYVPQMHTPAFDYRVLDFVLMGRAPHTGIFGRPSSADEEMCMEVLTNMGIADIAEKSYRNLSGGERQQLLIARAIVQEPEVVLFDEPTAHLDYGNQHRVLRKIKEMTESGYSVIMTTHNPDHALLLGDKAAIVGKDGSIVQGTCEEIVTEEKLQEVYGIELKLMKTEEAGRVACVVPEL